MTEQQKIIEAIHSNTQGFVKSAVDNQCIEHIESYQNSLCEISERLYAETTHFIFELIQNADDNSYIDNEKPVLSFSISEITLAGKRQICLLVGNNEKWFQKNQIQAICKVGGSTKKRDASSIGEKGIGFKSVFAVTKCPYIFSNGYQFCLPQEIEICGTKLGYVVPRWIDSVPAECTETTNIVLPIKNQETLDKIIEELKALSPEIILFLRKLHRITISIDLDDEKYLNEIIREEQAGTSIVDLTCLENQGEDIVAHKTSYLYQSIELTKPEDVYEKLRTGIQTRPLTIAIPLCKNDNDGGQLFAYLPVQSGTGFPFLINADFVLTSARDELVENEWNQWLCGEIPNFYADIVEQAMSSPTLTKEQKISIFSRIPVSSYDPRFSKIIDTVHAELKQRKILLTFQSDALASPEECQRLGQDKRKILETLNWTPECMGEDIEQYLFLSTEISDFKDILGKLDVKDNQNSILPCFTEKLLLKIDNAQLLELYKYLIREKEEIGDTPLIPVWSGHKKCFVSAKNAAVFWSVPKDPFPRFPQKDVFFVLKAFYDYIHSLYEEKEKLDGLKKQLSELLGIKNFSITAYCTSLKSVLTDGFDGTPEEFINISHFLIENDVYPEYFVTNRGIVTSNEEIKYIVVSEDFDSEYGWQQIWQNENDRGHFAYLVGYSKEDQKKLIGKKKIDKYPLFVINGCNYTQWKYHNSQFYDEYTEVWRCSRFSVKQVTVECPVIPANLQYQTYIHFLIYHQAKTDASIKDFNIDLKVGLGICFKGNIFPQQYSRDPVGKEFPSKFFKELCQQPCIETNLGLKKPSDVWFSTIEIRTLFGDSVPYISQEISCELAQFWGIHVSLTLDDILVFLEHKSKLNAEVSLEIAKMVYLRLLVFFPSLPSLGMEVKLKIKNFFQQNKSIYIRKRLVFPMAYVWQQIRNL